MFGYIRQAWLVLALALGFGVALAAVNSVLSPYIKANEDRAKASSALQVVPGAASAERVKIALEARPGQLADTVDAFRVFDAKGELAGWAVPVEGRGYADVIRLMVGLSPDASRLSGVQVLFNNETPGLGNEITNPQWQAQFAGKLTYERIKPAKTADSLEGQQIQALSGATVSSQAVCDIILDGLAKSGLIYQLNNLSRGDTIQEGASDAR